MSEFKGTPGAWVVDEDFDVTTKEGSVISWTAVGVFDPEEIIANAKLIAAAPELLEALQAIMDSNFVLPKEVVTLANAAIAKALGQ